MMRRRVSALLFAALLVCPPTSAALAQTLTPGALREANAQKDDKAPAQKIEKALEKKALGLLDEMVDEAMTLKLVENRIYALTLAAKLHWSRNENRARALLREAISQFMLIEQPSEPDDPQALQTMQLRIELRTQLLQEVAAVDSKMALEFLRASRLPDAKKTLGGKGAGPDFERQFEIQLAIRAAENDPQTALQIAEDTLKDGLNPQVCEIWSNLLGKDPKAASKLSGEIMSMMKSSDMTKTYQPTAVAFSMLDTLRARIQEEQKAGQASPPSQTAGLSLQEMQQTTRDLLDLIISAALKVTASQLMDINEQGQVRNLLMQVQTLMPEIEKQLPARVGAVRAKLSQFDKAFYHPQSASGDYIFNDAEKRSPDELLAGAANAPADIKEMVYRQAAMKFLEQGDAARARQIAKDHLSGGIPGDPLLAGIEQAEREQALAQGRLEEAHKSISRMRSAEDRATALIGLAMKAEASQDQKTQRQLLAEAGELLGDQMETRAQVEAQLNLAAAQLNVNADRGFEIFGSAIDRLNVVLNAVTTLAKFDQRGGIFDGSSQDGEMRLSAGDYGNVTSNLDQQTLAFARKDFDRTVALIKHLQVNEVRLAMCLSLVSGILGEQKERRPYPIGFVNERIR
jgi:hypothetical protein